MSYSFVDKIGVVVSSLIFIKFLVEKGLFLTGAFVIVGRFIVAMASLSGTKSGPMVGICVFQPVLKDLLGVVINAGQLLRPLLPG